MRARDKLAYRNHRYCQRFCVKLFSASLFRKGRFDGTFPMGFDLHQCTRGNSEVRLGWAIMESDGLVNRRHDTFGKYKQPLFIRDKNIDTHGVQGKRREDWAGLKQ
jgi:hypothetical protein